MNLRSLELESPGVCSGDRLSRFPERSLDGPFSLARVAGGFGGLTGQTNCLPQTSSHSLDLELAKPPLSGDSTEAKLVGLLEREDLAEVE